MSIAIYDILSEISILKAAQRNLVPFVFGDLLPLESWIASTPKVTFNRLVEKMK
jgi:hypothetical protein